ncbi:MAG: NAD-dependent epimerase/dehydratase family protein [Chitinophagaceae bacterium]|nr:MAG: NAD-dependent epimerase/dehydratase family protein [Chitinophagaceae bacterium]
MSNKILITGGTGFLGSYIIAELVSKNYPVRAIRRGNKLPAHIDPAILAKVEWVEGDILDVMSLEDAMHGIHTVIHAAAIVSFSASDKQKMMQVNVDGTANVVNMALEAGTSRFVYISSVAAVGRDAAGGSVDESRKWQESSTSTQYAISKHKAEMEVWRAMGEGLDAVILNPSTILGFGDWQSGSSALFRNVYNEFPWYSPGLNGFVDVEDVARATVLLMESAITEERFIINGDNWTFQRLFETMADHLHKKRPSRETTRFLAGVAWRLEKIKSMLTGSRPVLTRESARVAFSKTMFNSSKLLAALPGFSFTSLDETIRKAGSRYLEAANSGK